MMTKNTSATTALIKKIALTPIMATLIYFSCFETVAQIKEIPAKTTDYKFVEDFTKAYTKAYSDNLAKDSQVASATIKPRKIVIEKLEEAIQDSIYSSADLTEKPTFPEGINAFFKFVSKNYRIPEDFSGSGKVFVQFVVEKDGSLSNLRILRDAGDGTGDEALRVLSQSPRWLPGKINGEPVRCSYSLPITLMQK